MVQIKSAFLCLLTVTGALSVATPHRRTVAQVESDLATVSTDVTNLLNLVNSFPSPGGSIAIALEIHNAAVALEGVLKTTTADTVATGVVSVADGNTVLSTVQKIEPNILSALSTVVSKKQGFTTVNGEVGGTIALLLQDLKDLNGNTTALANALIADAPSSLVANATAIKNTIASAFATAIAAYSS